LDQSSRKFRFFFYKSAYMMQGAEEGEGQGEGHRGDSPGEGARHNQAMNLEINV
jgi:hypothetical protein